MVLSIIIASITCITLILSILFFPRIKIGRIGIGTYWIVALIGATLMIVTSRVSLSSVFSGLTSSDAINPLKILCLFISMTILSIFLDEVGFFKHMANIVCKKAGSNQIKLFLYLYILTSILTIFTSNDIIILTFTPFIVFFTKNAKINPIPYLVSEFVAANTWSMMFIIGNPTNIYLATSFNLGFLDYFKVMILPTIAAGSVSLGVLYLLFRKELKEEMVIEAKDAHVKSRKLVISEVIILGVCTLILIVSNYIGIEMYLVALFCALMMLGLLVLYSIKKHNTVFLFDGVKRIPWNLAPFLLSMFVIVLTDKGYQINDKIREFYNHGNSILVYGASSTLASNLINNIPMSVFYSSIIPENDLGALFSTIIGSNIGAFLTPIGALAGIMWLSILKKYEIKYSFLSFIKYGVIVVIPTLCASLLTLFLVL